MLFWALCCYFLFFCYFDYSTTCRKKALSHSFSIPWISSSMSPKMKKKTQFKLMVNTNFHWSYSVEYGSVMLHLPNPSILPEVWRSSSCGNCSSWWTIRDSTREALPLRIYYSGPSGVLDNTTGDRHQESPMLYSRVSINPIIGALYMRCDIHPLQHSSCFLNWCFYTSVPIIV